MENFDTEFITSLLNEEKTTEEVSLILQDMYSNKRELPLRSLKRYCAKYQSLEYQGGHSEIRLTSW